jgi:O-antigen/teichoic acid export membrane protein
MVMFWLTARRLPFVGWPALHRAEIAPLLRFGGWISISGAVIPMLTIVDRLIIGARLGVAAVTAYTVPFNLTQRFTYLPSALNTTLFPRFSQTQMGDNKNLMTNAVTSLIAIQTPFIVTAILLMHPFLVLWIGASLANQSAPVAIILLIGIWINGPSYPCYSYLQAIGRPDIMTKFYLIELVPFLVFLWYFVSYFGILGAAIAWSLRMTIDAIAWFAASNSLSIFWKPIALTTPLIIASIITTIFSMSMPLYIMLSVGIILACIYISKSILPISLKEKLTSYNGFFFKTD